MNTILEVVWPRRNGAGLDQTDGVRGGSLLESYGRARPVPLWAAQSYPASPTGVSAIIHRAAETGESAAWRGGSHSVLFMKDSAWRGGGR